MVGVQKYGVCEDVPYEKWAFGVKKSDDVGRNFPPHCRPMLCGKSYCTSEPAINETDRLEALGHSNPSFSSSSFSSPSSPCRKNLTLKTAQGPPSSKTDRGLADLGRLSKGETP